jgi:hypothetical protein
VAVKVLVQTMKVLLKAMRVLLKAVRVLLKAERVLVVAIRVLVVAIKKKSACEGRTSGQTLLIFLRSCEVLSTVS